jgi:single-stranded-DNA-specific exonuclease
MPLIEPHDDWRINPPAEVSAEVRELAEARGLGPRLLRVLARRGPLDAAGLRARVDPPESLLHDPLLLPDAVVFRDRIRAAVLARERVLVFGDFDADGLTGLAILTLALRRLGLDVEPYVPSRKDEGHGLSQAAIARAQAADRSLIVTVDCGTTSVDEVAIAARAGIDVLISDHHAVPARLPQAGAIVNPHRADSVYPDPRLSGAGVAFKVAALLHADQPGGAAWAHGLADLAAVGTVADLVPMGEENRAILRMGLRTLRAAGRPGIAALAAAAGLDPARIDADAIGYAIAPRINAVGRVGDAGAAVRLLLAESSGEATEAADELERANVLRKELLAAALAEARPAAANEARDGVLILAGPWPVGIIGLVAGRLAEEHGVPSVVFSTAVDPWRGSGRSVPGFDLAAAFAACGDLFDRFGGHPGAAGCHLSPDRYTEFRSRMRAVVASAGMDGVAAAETETSSRQGRAGVARRLDLVLRAESADYVLFRELSPLEDGADEPALVGFAGFEVARARLVSGGHTQLTLRRGHEVLDGICFGRPDLADVLADGQVVDLVARLVSRTFGGYESLQLDVRDVAPSGWLRGLVERTSSAVRHGRAVSSSVTA